MPQERIRILVVEDDPEIGAMLSRSLESEGYAVEVAGSSRAADALIARQPFAVALLDIMLPGESGLALCRRLRANHDTRIIMVTALSEPVDRVAGLDQGADDYLCKPFDLPELAARIRAVLRRPSEARLVSSDDFVMEFAGWRFYPHRRYIRSPDDVRVSLTGAETDLLLTFCQHPQEILSRDQLIAWIRDAKAPVPDRAIDLLVSRLRRKLTFRGVPSDALQTVRTDGYMLRHSVTLP